MHAFFSFLKKYINSPAHRNGKKVNKIKCSDASKYLNSKF